MIKQDPLTERPPKTGGLLTVLRRLDAVLENSKEELLEKRYEKLTAPGAFKEV